MDAKSASCKLKAMNIYAATMATVQLLGILVFPQAIPDAEVSNFVSWVLIFSYITLCISYTVVIVQLRNVIQNMKQHFKREYHKIMLQFIFFDLAFFSAILLQILFFAGERFFGWNHFTFTILQGTFDIPVVIVPISFMLYSHHSTFKK